MGKTLFLCFLFVLCTFSQAQEEERIIDPEIQKEIDDFIQNVYLPSAGVSSLALTITNNASEIVYTTGYGLANQEKGIPAGNSTQFLIASITKSVTALVALKELGLRFPLRGEAVLDTPIRQLLPETDFTLNDRFRTEHTTVRDLLSHRLCLPNDGIQIKADSLNSTGEIVYRTRYNEPSCGIRTKFEYNNQAYVIIGELISHLAGRPYETVVKDLLTQIGMTSTVFMSPEDRFPEMENRAQPYYKDETGNSTHPYNPELVLRISKSSAAGGLFSTPDDMAKYIRFLLNKGMVNVNGEQLVPANLFDWLQNPSSFYPGLNYKKIRNDTSILNKFGYGLGLMIGSYDGWKKIDHSGWLPPYISLMSFYPAKNFGIFTATNEGPLKQEHEALHAFIFDVLRGKSRKEAEKNAARVDEQVKRVKAKESQKLGRKVQRLLEQVKLDRKQEPEEPIKEGQYGSGSAGELTISREFNEAANETQLFLNYGRFYKGWLEFEGFEGLYIINWVTDVYQDNYVIGDYALSNFLFKTADDDLWFVQPVDSIPTQAHITGVFRLGVSLDTLPPIPWPVGSC